MEGEGEAETKGGGRGVGESGQGSGKGKCQSDLRTAVSRPKRACSLALLRRAVLWLDVVVGIVMCVHPVVPSLYDCC